MNIMNDQNKVSDLYINKDTLSIRKSLHEKYSVNKFGFSNWIYDQYTLKSDMRVLEVGAGLGNFWKDKLNLLPKNIQIYLTDFSPLMVEHCQTLLAANCCFSFVCADIQNLPFADESFDVVIANHILYHVPDINLALSEVKRVLRQGGKFYATTIGEDNMQELQRVYKQCMHKCKFILAEELSFTLDNGENILNKYFDDVNVNLYNDSLDVTCHEDLLDYIKSYNEIPCDFESEFNGIIKNMFTNGRCKISKSQGMFVCKK